MGKKKLKERKQPRFIVMIVLTGIYFFVELIVGLMTGSLALLSDAFHMLSDELSLFIGFYAIRASKRAQTEIMTFGWARAEIVGALINSVFLLALCLMIFIEAMQRFFEPSEISDPVLLLVVGSIGLLINIVGLFLFMGHGGHGHSHGGHGHSHGGHGHKSHSKKLKNKKKHKNEKKHEHGHGEHEHDEHEHEHEHEHKKKQKHEPEHEHGHEHDGHEHGHGEHEHEHEHDEHGPECDHEHGHGENEKEHEHGHGEHGHGHGEKEHGHEEEHNHNESAVGSKKKKGKGKLNLNMHGVFLHVLGDALGSILVIIIGIILVAFPDFEGAVYLDPSLSIIIVMIILFSTIPLVKQSSTILLQSVPPGISLPALKDELRKIIGVLDVHELHLWQLTHDKFVASCHLICDSAVATMEVGKKAKAVFHDHGVHATTVQTEYKKIQFEDDETTEVDSDCQLVCKTKDCQEKMCCSKTIKKRNIKSLPSPHKEQFDDADKGRLDLFDKDF